MAKHSSRINEWLSLTANIGVVIGIFVLVAEVNHASKLAEVGAYQTRVKDIQELNLQLALSETLADILNKADTDGVAALTPGEFSRAQSWYATILRGMQGQYYQYQQGFLDRESVDRTLDDIAGGIHKNWEKFGLLGKIEIQEWRAEINRKMRSASET